MKTLKYRKLAFYFYRLLILGSLSFIFITIVLNLYSAKSGEWFLPLVRTLISCGFALTILYRAIYYFRPRIRSTYDLYSDKLIIHQGKKQKIIEFSQVMKVKFTIMPPRFIGGFKIFLKSGQSFLFLSLLEDNHTIIESLAFYKPDLVSDKRNVKYKKTNLCVGESWRRIQKALSKKQTYIVFISIQLLLLLVFYISFETDYALLLIYYLIFNFMFLILFVFLYSVIDSRLNSIEYQAYLNSGQLKKIPDAEVSAYRVLSWFYIVFGVVIGCLILILKFEGQ